MMLAQNKRTCLRGMLGLDLKGNVSSPNNSSINRAEYGVDLLGQPIQIGLLCIKCLCITLILAIH